MKSDARQAEDEFLDAITAINLRRIWAITLIGSVLSVAVFIVELLVIPWSGITEVSASDVIVSLLAIGSVWLVRRRPRRGIWPRVFVAGMAVTWMVSLDFYYFSALSATSHNASYVIGVMCAAVFFLQPPTTFLPALGINHAVYCARLLMVAHASGRSITAPLIDGTVGMTIAGMASWILYHAARENIIKERIIVERNRALALTNAELREVMAIAAHDLRSPLLDTRNLLALGRREAAATSPTLDGILEQGVDACERLARLVSRLVEAHAAEDAGQTMKPQLLDLRDGCQTAVARAQATAERKGQRIALSLPETPAPARVDVALLDRVLDNLLGNALKFSAAAATIELALQARRDGVWNIEVRDEGPGMPPSERAQLFRKFHRGRARPTGGESSTGLGLFIVKALAEAMGGTVRYTPREPTGAIFAVELPMAANER